MQNGPNNQPRFKNGKQVASPIDLTEDNSVVLGATVIGSGLDEAKYSHTKSPLDDQAASPNQINQ